MLTRAYNVVQQAELLKEQAALQQLLDRAEDPAFDKGKLDVLPCNGVYLHYVCI